ncbi:hypothetical protein [Martelella mediterranea]|uniref:hypothetical protein n=1 Tax=Martelella mediterranea TaxID=293089 RepID=UPI0003605CC2|nr:hypothetical protein [Martelella mediterranea]
MVDAASSDHEALVIKQAAVQRNIGLYALHDYFKQCAAQPRELLRIEAALDGMAGKNQTLPGE